MIKLLSPILPEANSKFTLRSKILFFFDMLLFFIFQMLRNSLLYAGKSPTESILILDVEDRDHPQIRLQYRNVVD